MPNVIAGSKVWPTADDLLSWFLHDKLDRQPGESPGEIRGWLQEYGSKPPHHWHAMLWAAYADFRGEFKEPDR